MDLFLCAMAQRDPVMASRAVAAIPAEGFQDTNTALLIPREWFGGLAARSFGDAAAAQAAFTAARLRMDKIVRQQPEYAEAWSLLGLIDAGLGHKEDAIREGRRACALLPPATDALTGPFLVQNLAQIYAWAGEKDLALQELSTAAKLPFGVNYGELKLGPQWDSLRGDVRFDQIVASLAPKEAK